MNLTYDMYFLLFFVQGQQDLLSEFRFFLPVDSDQNEDVELQSASPKKRLSKREKAGEFIEKYNFRCMYTHSQFHLTSFYYFQYRINVYIYIYIYVAGKRGRRGSGRGRKSSKKQLESMEYESMDFDMEEEYYRSGSVSGSKRVKEPVKEESLYMQVTPDGQHVQVTYPEGCNDHINFFEKIKALLPRKLWSQVVKVLNMFNLKFINRIEVVKCMKDIFVSGGLDDDNIKTFEELISYNYEDEKKALGKYRQSR